MLANVCRSPLCGHWLNPASFQKRGHKSLRFDGTTGPFCIISTVQPAAVIHAIDRSGEEGEDAAAARGGDQCADAELMRLSMRIGLVEIGSIAELFAPCFIKARRVRVTFGSRKEIAGAILTAAEFG